jgi:hypothetical protein
MKKTSQTPVVVTGDQWDQQYLLVRGEKDAWSRRVTRLARLTPLSAVEEAASTLVGGLGVILLSGTGMALTGRPRKNLPTLCHFPKGVVHFSDHPQKLHVCSLQPFSQFTTHAHFWLKGFVWGGGGGRRTLVHVGSALALRSSMSCMLAAPPLIDIDADQVQGPVWSWSCPHPRTASMCEYCEHFAHFRLPRVLWV